MKIKRHGGCAGGKQEPEYKLWAGIVARCHYPGHTRYAYYGGRGIKVCKKWRRDYPAFRAWAKKEGFVPGLQIDRINNAMGYQPSNCRFVTAKQNCLNRDSAIRFGKRSSEDVAFKLGMSRQGIRYRVKKMGLSLAQAESMPKQRGASCRYFWNQIGKWKE